MPTSSRRTIPTRSAPPARPLKTTPCYDRMKELGAVFGSVYGWERPNWFAPEGYARAEEDLETARRADQRQSRAGRHGRQGRIVEKWSFRRSNYFEHVGDECRNVMESVGLQDMSPFAKMDVSGPGAREWLESDPRQPDSEEAGPHRALPSAHQATAASGPSSRSMNGRPAASTSSRPAPTSATTTTR